MNFLNLYVSLYGCLYNRKYVPSKLLSPFRWILRRTGNIILPLYLNKKKIIYSKKIDDRIVVSLTTFPARIESVWMVVECMLRQSIKPYKIILWLSERQFKSIDGLPNSLKSRLGDVFQIRFVKEDYRSHKKYFYVFKEFENDIVITVDDDILYPTTMIENLYKTHLKQKDAVVCRYGKVIEYYENKMKPYGTWREYFSLKEKNVFFGSGGGTLFVPKKLCADVCNIDLALELCPLADDIWLNAMARMNKLKIIPITRFLIFPIIIRTNETLSSVNVNQNMNDVQLKAVNDFYFEKLHFNLF